MNRRPLVLKMLLVASFLVLCVSASAQTYDYSYARIVRLSLVDGDVQFAKPDTEGWEQAVVNLPIQEGMSLATGQGRAEIEFESGATVRLAENSILQFTQLALADGGRITKLTLTQGSAIFYANLSSKDSFVAMTPNTQVSIPEKASFRVDAAEDGTTVSVFKGEVSVDSRAGTNRLTKGHTLSYNTSEPDQVQLGRNAKADEFEHWAADRDEVVRAGDSQTLRYVNSPYSYGLADLSSYGSWYDYSGYGQCWQPYGLGPGWSPFSAGQYVFFRGIGWSWVSFEPWGWLPYHFGTWLFLPGRGWLWVPGYVGGWRWRPAQVHWVRVGNQTAWVPLHPHDQPGKTPINLQHGVLTAGNGGSGGRNVKQWKLGPDEHPEVVIGPHTGFTMPGPAHVKVGDSPPAVMRNPRGIVYDPKERKFVNNPNGGAGARDKIVGDAHVGTEDTPGKGNAVSGKGPTPPPAGIKPPAPGVMTVKPPAVPQGGTPKRPDSPPPPRVETPAPPRVVTPPPPPPAQPKPDKPHFQSERSRPSVHWESAPRPSAPAPAAAPASHPSGGAKGSH